MKITDSRFTGLSHTIFWSCYFLAIFFYFSETLVGTQLWVKAFTSGFYQMILVYLNIYWLTPKFFFKNKYSKYFLLMSVLFVAVVWLRVNTDAWLFPNLDDPYPNKSVAHYVGVSVTLFIIVTMTATLRFMQERVTQDKKRQELLAKQLDAELKFLKTQINPHFLFNALNNIYALTYTNSKDAAPMVLKLSNILRYILYEGKDKMVMLGKEIDYIRDYIALMSMEAENVDNIRFEVNGDLEGKGIEPMLFIPFIENAFKHSNALSDPDGVLNIQFDIKAEHLEFNIENSKSSKDQKKDKAGGIGLENVKRRLELIYPKKHNLRIDDQQSCFIANLQIRWS